MSRKSIITRAMAAADAACEAGVKASKAGQDIPNRLGAFHGAALSIYRQARIHDPLALRVAAAVLRRDVWMRGSLPEVIRGAAAVLGMSEAEVTKHYFYDVVLALGAVRDLVYRTKLSLAPSRPASYSLPTGPLVERLVAKREALVRHTVETTLRTGSGDHVICVVPTEDAAAVGIQVRRGTVCLSLLYGEYVAAPSSTTITITVPHRWLSQVHARHLAVVDGRMTLDAAPVGTDLPDIEVFATTWVRQGRGVAATAVRGFIARSITGSGTITHHSLSLKGAIAGLRSKRRATDGAAGTSTAQARGHR